jgi:hypothetical protein
MADFFSRLGEARRPWLDAEALKQKFLTLSAAAHPDRFHAAGDEEKRLVNQRFAELTAAFNCLRNAKDRLQHLLELERECPLKDVQRIPPGTMDLFMEVGQLCRDIDVFLTQKSQVTSPMLKVALLEQSLAWRDKLVALQQRIQAKREGLEADLKTLNAVWESAPATAGAARRDTLPLDRLEQIYRIFSYVDRWLEQVQERMVQLAF